MSERDPERFDELESALTAVFSGRDVPKDVGEEPRDLALLAGYLLGLPREEFRASLKAELVSPGAASETTPAEPESALPESQSVTPYIVVSRAEELMTWAGKAFGATELVRSTGSAGGFHGEVRIGNSRIMMGGYAGMPDRESLASLHLYVADADATYRRALAAGATSIEEPVDQFYGDREAGILDPFGNRWFIATHKKGPSYVPEGMRTVTPFFLVGDASGWMRFLTAALGAEEVARVGAPEGGVRYAKMRIGDSVLEMGQAHGAHAASTPAMLYVLVEDADASYARAVERRAGRRASEAPALRRTRRAREGRAGKRLVPRIACPPLILIPDARIC
jgi:PhnB protein